MSTDSSSQEEFEETKELSATDFVGGMISDGAGTGIAKEHPMWGPWPRKTGVSISFSGEISPLEPPASSNGKTASNGSQKEGTVITARQKETARRTRTRKDRIFKAKQV